MVDRSLAAQAESLAGVEALDIKDLNIGLGHAENLRREEVKKKKNLTQAFCWDEIARSQWFRIKWLYSEIKFKVFHTVANGRRRINKISSITPASRRVEEKNELEEAFMDCYEQLYTSEGFRAAWLTNWTMPRLSTSSSEWLEREFPVKEIKGGGLLYGKIESLRPEGGGLLYGFNLAYFQHCWDFVKEDLPRMYEKFYANGMISVVVATFIVLFKDRMRRWRSNTLGQLAGLLVYIKYWLKFCPLRQSVSGAQARGTFFLPSFSL